MNINFVLNRYGTHRSIVDGGGGATEFLGYMLAYKLSKVYTVKVFNLEPSQRIDNIEYRYLPVELEEEARSAGNSVFIILDYIDFPIGLCHINKNHKYILWCHNYLEGDWQKYMRIRFSLEDVNTFYSQNNITTVAVSQFHGRNISSIFPDMNVVPIYNSIHPELFPRRQDPPYDRNKMIFASRWSKGLDKVIGIGIEYYKRNRDFKLVLIKPSYCKWDPDTSFLPFIEKRGNVPSKEEYSALLQSCLAVFSTSFPETFGCVFAEALHLGVPVICDTSVESGVHEIVEKKHCCDFNDHEQVIGLIETFRKNRPEVSLGARFYDTSVLKDWEALFSVPIMMGT